MHAVDPDLEARRREAAPPTRVRLVGKAMCRTVLHAPALWPLLRGPMTRWFDAAAEGWDERTEADGPRHLAAFAAGLTHVAPQPERALDIGTGTGAGALLIAREFPSCRVRGVDTSEEMIRAARAKVGLDPEGRIAFKVADAADLAYEDESFDMVAGLNIPPFVGEICRVLRPGGHAVIAASSGPMTPFYTPAEALERAFAKHGVHTVEAGEADLGTYWVGRADG